MGNLDFKTARFLSIVLGICLVFVLVVSNAYKYIPEPDTTNAYIQELQNKTYNENTKEVSDVKTEESIIDDKKEEILEEFSVPEIENNQNNYDEQIKSIFKEAFRLTNEKKYNSAIYEYEKALKLANNRIDETICYDNLALIYATQNRYTKALEMAEKSYSIIPNSYRELIIAKINYKMGDSQKANIIITKILNREFSTDDK